MKFDMKYENRCSGKVNAHYLRILLKIISTEIIKIISISVILICFWSRINSPHTQFYFSGAPTLPS